MDKRYQVFISSTFADLQAVRTAVFQTVMQLDCVPAGMELFPAIDDEQWAFIRRIIDDCDYYALLVGGRYGSVDPNGVSFTEREYDYAVERGRRVVAFLHEAPHELRNLGGAPESDEAYEKLMAFRTRVSRSRLVKFWSDPAELPGLVALSLARTIRTYPAVGWIRADRVASADVLQELNEIRKQRDQLQVEVQQLRAAAVPLIPDLAGLDEIVPLGGSLRRYSNGPKERWSTEMTIREVFAAISPYLVQHPNDVAVKHRMEEAAFQKAGRHASTRDLDDQIYQTLKLQLIALKLVKVEYSKTTKGGMALFWSLTPAGRRLMFESRVIRSTKQPGQGTQGSTPHNLP